MYLKILVLQGRQAKKKKGLKALVINFINLNRAPEVDLVIK